MLRLTFIQACTCLLTLWITGLTSGCGDLQTEENGLCCDKCPPGTYMKDFCTADHQTICRTCKEGFFADQHHVFDGCELCQSCQQAYSENCTATTNAKCSCHPGFLCANNFCSVCVENKCDVGDIPKKTVNFTDGEMEEYTYECEPVCPDNSYLVAGVCKIHTLCGALGLAELFPGNKTHNSVCEKPESKSDGDSTNMFLGFACVSLSFVLLLTLSYICMKSLRKQRARKQPYKATTLAVAAHAGDFQLSKEESGHKFILKDEYKDADIFC